VVTGAVIEVDAPSRECVAHEDGVEDRRHDEEELTPGVVEIDAPERRYGGEGQREHVSFHSA
jgi:hypothetical protein